MQVVIKPYDMLTIIFYGAHSHNHITLTICLLRFQDNLHDMLTIIIFYDAYLTEQVEYNQMQVVIKPYDMLTIIFYNAHSHSHITITIFFLRCQEIYTTC